MFCNNCGAQLTENTRFCPNCGQLVQSAPQDMTAASTYEGPMGNPTPVLVWGIVGLAFACSFFLSFLGIIFSIVGLKKANNYFDFCGEGSKQARIGRNLSKAGLIVGIIMTVLCVLYIVLIVVAAVNYGSSYSFELSELLEELS